MENKVEEGVQSRRYTAEVADTEAILEDESMKLKNNPKKVQFYRQVGQVKCYFHKSNGVPRIFIGPTWYYAALILFMTVFFISITSFLVI